MFLRSQRVYVRNCEMTAQTEENTNTFEHIVDG